jgi:hypothetical protein
MLWSQDGKKGLISHVALDDDKYTNLNIAFCHGKHLVLLQRSLSLKKIFS